MDEPKKKFFTMPKVSLGLGLTATGVWGLLSGDTLKSFVSDAWREDAIRMAVVFTLVLIATRFFFRKDMEESIANIVTPVVDALNKIADRSEATDIKLNEINNKVTDHGERLMLIEQHLTPRQT